MKILLSIVVWFDCRFQVGDLNLYGEYEALDVEWLCWSYHEMSFVFMIVFCALLSHIKHIQFVQSLLFFFIYFTISLHT